MNEFILSRHNAHHSTGAQRSRTISRSLHTGPVAATMIVILFIFVLGVWYLYEEGHLATKGYEIQTLQKQVDDLAEQNRKLEFNVAQSRSIQKIEESAQHLNMVQVSKIVYIHRSDSSVAALSR